MAGETDPFAPVPSSAPDRPEADGMQPIVPVPADAQPPSFHHPKLGQASHQWQYNSLDGELIGYVARFETRSGKEIVPLSYWQMSDGRCTWRWKSFEKPRPLFNLQQLSHRAMAPVLLVEGEKTACAAQMMFSDHVVTTWPGGAQAIKNVDWSGLKGRDVVLWGDADEPGSAAMQGISGLLQPIAQSVRLVRLPPGLPEGWDLADTIPEGVDVRLLLEAASPQAADHELPGYAMTGQYLTWRDPAEQGSPERQLSGRFDIVAETHDAQGFNWGLLLAWLDASGHIHQRVLPRSALATDGVEARRLLLSGGLFVAQNRRDRDLLTTFLLNARSSNRIAVVSRIGWHNGAFVLPDRTIGASSTTSYMIEGLAEHAFRQKGQLSDWQQDIGRFAVGNSRLAFAISCALTAPLLHLCGGESGGFHFIGESSIGKTSALKAAGSVAGGEAGGYIKNWRATANGLEGLAAAHCDCLLCLDELSQVEPDQAAEAAYLLANGAGKTRANKDGSARPGAEWRVLVLSSGEITLGDKIAESRSGRRTAGQEVRIIDLQANAGQGHGIFETLHSFGSANDFANHLRAASDRTYGTALIAFLEAIVREAGSIASTIDAKITDFLKTMVPADADGQVLRAACRFGLVAAAGELGVAERVLPWPEGEATSAAKQLFREWVDARGGYEPAELRDAISLLHDFITKHGMTRFRPAWQPEASFRAPNDGIVGFRKRSGDAWEYFLTSAGWKTVLGGLAGARVAERLAKKRFLLPPVQVAIGQKP